MAYTTDPRSLEFRFSVSDDGMPDLVEVSASHVFPVDLIHQGRHPDDGCFWGELEDASGTVVHSAPLPGLMEPSCDCGAEPDRGVRQFSFDLPYHEAAVCLVLYGPPANDRGARREGSGPGGLIGRYAFPDTISPAVTAVENPVLPFDVCGSGRGEVLGMTNLVHHGTHEECFTLMIVGDGFLDSEQDKFMRLARESVTALFATPPINRGLQSQNFNVVAVRVASKSNAWSKPDERYFSVIHPADANYGTLLEWNYDCVRAVGTYLGISYDWAGVIVNEPLGRYGTKFNRQFAATIPLGWINTWVHEFGHAAFSLGDEYMGDKGSYTGRTNYPNLTTETERDKIDWHAMIEPDTPLPTLGNPPGCRDPGGRISPIPPDGVGLFAGGIHYVCDIYHGQHHCVMNNSSQHRYFCRVCYDSALQFLLRNPRILSPIPAISRYSIHDRAWTTPKVAGDVYATFGPDKNSPNFDAILEELLSGKIGPVLDARLKESVIYQPPDDPIYQGAYDPDTRTGHWFIFSGTYYDTVYLWTATTETTTLFGFARSELINFPTLSEFDSVPLGVQTVLFAASGGYLEMGTLSSTFEMEGDGMAAQHAQGLGTEVTGVSSVIIRPRAFVSVIEGLTVKMGVYQFVSESWSEEGFVPLPGTEDLECRSVRSTTSDRSVAVLSNTDSGLKLGFWDSAKRAWTGEAASLPGPAGVMPHYDIAHLQGGLAVVWYDNAEGKLMMVFAVTADGEWGDPIDITADSGLPADAVVGDLAAAGLSDELHIVMLLDGEAQHATFNGPAGTWEAFKPIPTLMPVRTEVQALTLHADDPQLFLGLSERNPLTSKRTETS